MNNPADYRVRSSPPGTRRPVTLESIRWAVHLGANTVQRYAMATGVPVSLAEDRIGYAAKAGVIVIVGKVPGKTRHAAVYATPDPEAFP